MDQIARVETPSASSRPRSGSVDVLGDGVGRAGASVLAIDFDPQFALTRSFGVSPAGRPTICDVFRDGAEVAAVLAERITPGVDLVPSSRDLSAIELSLVGEREREYFLARALAEIGERYDVVLVDCPPDLGLLTVNALCACDEVMVPIDLADVDAVHGAEEVTAIVRELADSDDSLRLRGLLRVVVDPRRQVNKAIAAELERSELLLRATEIPDSVDFQKSAVVHAPLVTRRPSSDGARACCRFAAELGVPATAGTR